MKNFFEHQDTARRNSGVLVALFSGGVLGLTLALYVTAMLFVRFPQMSTARQNTGSFFAGISWFDGTVLGWTIVIVLCVVGGSALIRLNSLSGGGSSVALSMGARLANLENPGPKERQYINIVEEMAIASGVPVPQVFVLESERGINAFAAGYSPNDAAVCVTRGCMELLSRDELQGVIAHEFSHILNGDMRLNIRLIAVLAGIQSVGAIGMQMVRVAFYTGGSRRRGSDDGRSGLPLAAAGLVIAAIGGIGLLFGRLIQAAVSRQREYLADASAVQFTRNPRGISGALKKIGGLDEGSRVNNPHAREYSHFFFAHGLSTKSFGGAMATHPPLPDRIERIEPGFLGTFAHVEGVSESSQAPSSSDYRSDPPSRSRSTPAAGSTGDPMMDAARDVAVFGGAGAVLGGLPGGSSAMPGAVMGIAGASDGRMRMGASDVVAQAGAPTEEHVDYGASVLASIPDALRDAAHDPFGAVALVYSLLLSSDAAERAQQLDALKAHAAEGVCDETARLRPIVEQLDPHARLPLVSLCAPALHRLSAEQHRDFAGNVNGLIAFDSQISVFEYATRRLLMSYMMRVQRKARRGSHFASWNPLAHDVQVVLSALAWVGGKSAEDARRAFDDGLACIPPVRARVQRISAPEECGWTKVDTSIERLANISTGMKSRLVAALATTAMADREVTLDEAELLRALIDVLGCPMPPFLPQAN